MSEEQFEGHYDRNDEGLPCPVCGDEYHVSIRADGLSTRRYESVIDVCIMPAYLFDMPGIVIFDHEEDSSVGGRAPGDETETGNMTDIEIDRV